MNIATSALKPKVLFLPKRWYLKISLHGAKSRTTAPSAPLIYFVDSKLQNVQCLAQLKLNYLFQESAKCRVRNEISEMLVCH
jgi:hypothetical protein